MISEIEYFEPSSARAGEPALVRFVGQPAGPAGTATVEIGDGCMFVVDAAEPTQIVETLLRAPVKDNTKGLLRLVLGDKATAAVENDGQSFEVEQTPHIAAIGRLALLYLVRDAMPVPTHRGLWALEAAQLASSIQSPICQEHAISELLSAKDDLTDLQVRFSEAPKLGRLVRSLENDLVGIENIFKPLDQLIDWFRMPEQQPSVDLLPSQKKVSGNGSVGWDRVPPGVIDPREDNIEIQQLKRLGDRQGIIVRILAQEGAGQQSPMLNAHIYDANSGQKLLSIPLGLSEDTKEFQGMGILSASLDSFIVDISSELDEPSFTSREVALKHRARRNAFRALFFERRAIHGAAYLADKASLLWVDIAKDYESIGAVDLAGRARARIGSGIGNLEPFAAEMIVPVGLL